MRLVVLMLAWLGLLTPPLVIPWPARAAEDLLWLKASWAPVFVEQGDGFGDAALNWLKQRLPAYRHAERFQPLPRLQLSLAETPHACTAGLARNPAREQQFLFSRDFLRMPGLAIIARPGHARQFERHASGHAIDMARLLADNDIDGVINENRSYGAALDPLLQAVHPERLKRLTRASTMVAMLAADRVDWVLLYPFEATWQARRLKPEPALLSLPIAGQKPVIASGIACARSDFGRRVVEQVDMLIAAHPDHPWQAALDKLLDPETRLRMAAN